MPRPRFQFRLRTLFVVMTAWAVLLSQWPLVEQRPTRYDPWKRGFFPSIETTIVSKVVVVPSDYDEAGDYFVPTRVIVASSIEGAMLIGWLIWRRLRRSATRD